MSGHSKWHSIKHKKGAADAKRGKIFTRHAKLITIAAQNNGDPEMNPRLRTEIDRAKAAGVPNANIDRAIKKGTGELDGEQMTELTYEAYAPGGIALLITALTDNKNRTVQEIRTTLTRYGGQMANSGSVAYLFNKRGLILANLSTTPPDQAELLAIEAGAEDLNLLDNQIEIITTPENLKTTEDNLSTTPLQITETTLTYLPPTLIPTPNPTQLQNLLEALEDLDDTDQIYHNADLPNTN